MLDDRQIDFFDSVDTAESTTQTPALRPLKDYDKIIVAVSGGKDSVACVLHLLESGVKAERLELWHHDVDGTAPSFMDWPVTRSYCKAFGEAFNIPVRFSWRDGGFKGEMLRDQSPTGDVFAETPSGLVRLKSKPDRLGTRFKFPQQSASLSSRWCSGVLKIDVCARAICGTPEMASGNFLFVTGERAEESSNRAKYAEIERHRTYNLRRNIIHWRPVLRWTEAQIWSIIERHRVRPHPVYELFGRVSCMTCIFANSTQWATVRVLDPARFELISDFERRFGVTIRRDGPITACADKSKPLEMPAHIASLVMSDAYPLSIVLPQDEIWCLPAGAYGESSGPT
jgi:3'-phosphoadenosine 5'-phosphosulfate sulfotransferase (PAPS reductase)/FAD synthetase